MPPVLDSLPGGARVLFIRLRSLGDCVLTTPALALLKQHRPDLEIAVLVEDRFAGVYEGNPDVSRILPPSAAAALRFRPDLTVNLHGGGSSIRLTLASLAPRRAAYAHFPVRWPYNLLIPRAQEILGEERKVHTAEHCACAVFWLGAPRREIPRARLFCAPAAVDKAYAVIHALASAPDKTWPAARFLLAAAYLEREMGLEAVFIGGPGDDLSAFSRYRTLAGAPLDEVKRVLSGATLFLGNDSGPAHMAAAFGLRSVVLFGASDPAIWAPWRTAHQILTAPAAGLRDLPSDAVIQALGRFRVPA